MEKSQDQMPSKEKDRWDKISIGVDIFHKIVILIIGSAVAGIFYWFQQQQIESRYFADLMAQRESTESQLRAQMFKTLFDAYFANKLQARAPRSGESSSEPNIPNTAIEKARVGIPQLDELKQETMFIDLLSRNFENIDVRPLFEEIDGQLTVLLKSTDKPQPVNSAAIPDLRNETFASRESIRRVAIGASSRQITALVGAAHATVTTHKIIQCDGHPLTLETPFPLHVTTIIDKLDDGVVTMRLVPDDQEEPIYLRVTFYDMPSLEKMILPSSRERIAFTLSRYISYNSCKEFKEQLDATLKSDCESVLSKKQACDTAWIRVVTFPNSYIGPRDRPYINDLLAGVIQNTSMK